MKQLPIRGAIAFGLPVVLVFVLWLFHPATWVLLAAGPLCGIIGGLAVGRRWGLAITLGLCFAFVGFMFSLQDTHSPLFTDVIWTGFVSAFLFWTAGGCAMLTLPPQARFNGAAAFGIPGAVAGFAFQFFYGPGRFLFDLGSRKWWGDSPWEHLVLWLIVGAGGGWLLGRHWQRPVVTEDRLGHRWALASIAFALFGLAIGALYFWRSSLPLGLFNSLSPASAAADWLWGWGVLATGAASIALYKPHRRWPALLSVALALVLLVASYRVEANPWKSHFNSNYAQKLLRENGTSGDAIYTGNLILAQTSLDKDDVANAKQYLLQAATTSGAHRIEQNGLDVSVARVLFDRGEKDAVLQYLQRGRVLWPQGAQTIGRWENAIKAGRKPNFNARGPGGPGGGGGGQGYAQGQ